MKTSKETRLLITLVKEVFRKADTYKMVNSANNAEALAEAEDFRTWLPQQTEQHFADPIEEAIENGIPSDALSLANYILWWYQEDNNETITFEEI
jgi:hypothetical protein